MTSNQATGEPSSKYIRQLDGLRGIAITGVLISHLLSGTKFAKFLPWGEIGVQLFFVLSGFLITDILLRSKAYISSGEQGVAFSLRQFYIRRFLRIFPIFYFWLLVLWLLNIPPVRETILWHLTYLSNVYFVVRGSGHGHVTHFWTLAVEEQFYLLWPLLVFFFPNKSLLRITLLLIVLAPVYRLSASLLEFNHQARQVLPIANFDSLGAGALLAILVSGDFASQRLYDYARKFSYLIGAPLFALFALLLATGTDPRGLEIVLFRSVMAMYFFWVVDSARRGFTGHARKFLEISPLVYLGKISYGVYIIHHFTLDFLKMYCDTLTLPYPDNAWLRFLVTTFVSIALSAITWTLFEQPLNQLKKHFPYRKQGSSLTKKFGDKS